MYNRYLYFLGLTLRSTSKSLILFRDDKRVMFLFRPGFKGLNPVRFTKKRVTSEEKCLLLKNS